MNRPYVIVNCAMSADGKIALPNGKQLRISCDEDIERMYKLRNECDAVLVGVNTIISDDPKLTVKSKYVKNPRQPIRIVLDSCCRTPADALVVNDVAKTIIATTEKCNNFFSDNVKIIKSKKDAEGHVDLNGLLKTLYKEGIKTLMVEGGSTVIWNFLKERLVDKLYIYVGPMIVGGKNTPTMTGGLGIKDECGKIKLKIIETKKLGPGILFHYSLVK